MRSINGLRGSWNPARRSPAPWPMPPLICSVVFYLCSLASPAWSESDKALSEVAADRAFGLQNVLTREPIDLVAGLRRVCASGQGPNVVARSRALGADTQPDSSDLCPTVLARISRDGDLLAPYRDLVLKQTGTSKGYERLPASIAVVAMKGGTNQVPIGADRAAVVTAALAFDAGFTVAFQKGERAGADMPELVVLKPVAERCLGQKESDLSVCYSVGYVYGARAVSGKPMAGPGLRN